MISEVPLSSRVLCLCPCLYKYCWKVFVMVFQRNVHLKSRWISALKKWMGGVKKNMSFPTLKVGFSFAFWHEDVFCGEVLSFQMLPARSSPWESVTWASLSKECGDKGPVLFTYPVNFSKRPPMSSDAWNSAKNAGGTYVSVAHMMQNRNGNEFIPPKVAWLLDMFL